MSFGQQPPPPKTTGTGTIVGVLALVFIGIPALLCLVGGIAIWGMAGFPGGKFGVGKEAAWQQVVAEKQRLERELIAELKTIADANNNRIPVSEVSRISSRGLEIDGKINELANRTHRTYGEPSQAVKDELKSTAELQRFVSTLNIPGNSFSMPQPTGPSMAERMAQQRAESEQRMAQLRAEQQQRDAQREAERQQREQQLAAQRLAEQQAREQRMREFANNVPQPFNPPPVFNNPPPVFNNSPPVNNPPAPQQPAANDAPPGFPATDVAQLKLKDQVFVQVGGQWHPAFVQLKRGKLVQVRSTENGAVELVTIERIRLQNEPTTKADSKLPSALQVAKAPKNTSGNTPEEEDDALFIAKPPGQQPGPQTPPAQSSSASTPSSPAEPVKPAAPPAEYRTWTNDTGEFKVEAELVNFEFDLVTLRRRDGKVLSLRIEKLSTADQAIIREKFK